ncbi:MAG: GMC family oxidoreductase [Hyalangium sp.]|uniref:GMC family oxidoreductase n=1 Tax=Hyalangium sp. TaxID=2028555 RepID=UPI00389A14F6
MAPLHEARGYDAIIVGAGAAGSVFAYELTKAGGHVLALERGPRHAHHRKDFTENELSMWRLLWDNSHYQVEGNGFHRTPSLGMGVGGGTLSWTAVSARFSERDFHFRSRHGQPAGSSVEDWPLSLAELEPDYDEAEAQMGVAGQRSPWDSETRREYPNPPMGYYPSSMRLRDGMARLGIRSAPGPVAINSRPYQGRGECLHCGYCRSGCRVDAKYQADQVLIAPALATGRLELRTEALVTRLEMLHTGTRVDGVSWLDLRTHREHRAFAKVVIVCNNPIETPRLFLNSANAFHPQGLANAYEQVGRHFFCHLGSVGLGITDDELDTSVGHAMGNLMSLDFRESGPGQPYLGGFSLLSLNGVAASILAVDPLRRFTGHGLKDRMKEYNKSLLLASFSEGLPSPNNRITVDRSRLDPYGQPIARVSYTLLDNDLRVSSTAVEKMAQVLRASGAREVHVNTPAFEAHPMGTMRMGTDPSSSVTNCHGQVHGIDNLFIGGASLFVTGGSVPPTLTLHALALRTARYLAQHASQWA